MTERNPLPRRIHPWLLLVVLLPVAGCDGGGSGTAAENPTEPPPVTAFTADRPAGNGSVSMRPGPGTSASLFELEIVANGLVDVLTMDFGFAYPAALLQLDSVRQGPFLGTDAALVVDQVGVGTLTVLLTRAVPAGAGGSGVVATVSFRTVAGGEGRFDFVDPEAADPTGLEIPGLDWIGGSVRIVL